MIQKERIKFLNNKNVNPHGYYILYWTQTSLRINDNFSLYLAIEKANELKKPLLVVFGLTDRYCWANRRQYHFLMQGLLEYKKKLEERGINFLVKKIIDESEYLPLINQSSVFICDKGYQRDQRKWRKYLSQRSPVLMIEVEGDVVFPIEVLAKNEIFFAYQIRKKIFNLLPYFINNLTPNYPLIKEEFFFQKPEFVKELFLKIKIDEKVRPVNFVGGETEAMKILDNFINSRLGYYQNFRSHPDKNFQSDLSPYLHFGFISPITIINKILEKYPLENINVISFINELVVWRELARNFVYFNPFYDTWKSLPSWSIETLTKHQNDKRSYLYSLSELKNANTHDLYWNAAQKEMLITGKMHNYMRMYWAKKVIEWNSDWRQAYQWLVYLNDKYELDGRDPNGYAGIAWSFGKFDRPWREREIFGIVRYMNEQGLEKKFYMIDYLKKIKILENSDKKR